MLTALLPDSFDTIEKLVRNSRLYEVHFTLFCYLDWVSYWPELFPLKKKTLVMLETFLLEVKNNAGSAAWMAGDLFGDHWPANESALVLANVLNNVRYAAGRRAALQGIETLTASGILNKQGEDAMKNALHERIKGDRSLTLRRDAAALKESVTVTIRST